MVEGVTHTRNRWRVFWPEVDDLAGAKEAIRLSVWFTFLAAALSAIAGVAALLGGAANGAALGGALLFALLGMGLLRRLRIAALLGVALLGAAVVSAIAQQRVPGVVDVITFAAMLSGVRGTFAHHRLIKAAARQPELHREPALPPEGDASKGDAAEGGADEGGAVDSGAVERDLSRESP